MCLSVCVCVCECVCVCMLVHMCVVCVCGVCVERPGDGCGSTTSLLHHGCMIPLLAIKFSARGAPCPDFLVSSHPFDWIEWALPIAT